MSARGEQSIWHDMIRRCHVPHRPDFHLYGGRGIAVCDRWRNSFADFLSDVGPRPSRAHSLDRIDGARGYEPGNVRWATLVEQNRNQRRWRRYEYRGQMLTAVQLAELATHSIKPNTLLVRLRSGWSVERAVTEPPRSHAARGSR